MNFLQKIFAPPSHSTPSFHSFAVKCDRCGEVIEGRINLSNDLSLEYGSMNPAVGGYYCRKVLMGTGRCFNRIEVELKFDPQRKLRDKQVSGGQFVE